MSEMKDKCFFHEPHTIIVLKSLKDDDDVWRVRDDLISGKTDLQPRFCYQIKL